MIKKLNSRIRYGEVKENEPMKNYTSFKVGGNADIVVIPDDIDELIHAVMLCEEESVPYYILGNGSNVIVRDGGFRGVIIVVSSRISEILVDGDTICAEAGALLSEVAAEAARNSLAGMEFAGGIPGSLGGAVYMNAGAYGGEMKDILISVEVLDIDVGKVFTVPIEDMELGYRTSKFQKGRFVILSAVLKLAYGEEEEIREKMRELNKKRNEKQPVTLPSAGSTFKRPEGHFAGKLIQDAGLQGTSLGGAQVSELHAGFVVNTGDATASDILNLMKIVETVVLAQNGVELEPEVRVIGEDLGDTDEV